MNTQVPVTGETPVIRLKTGSLYEEKRSYSRAVVIDNWILVANTAGRDYGTRHMSTDPAEQARKALANIEGSLRAVGASLADVVRSRVSIPYPEHKEAVMDVIAEAFRGIDPVATITACPLASPDYLVEIEVTGYKGAGSREVEHRRVDLSAG